MSAQKFAILIVYLILDNKLIVPVKNENTMIG